MVRKTVLAILFGFHMLNAFSAGPVPQPPGTFTILCYHEVRGVRDYPEPFAVNPTDLVRQFAWLRGSGYIPVSVNDIVAARNGGRPLPEKAILLSFDDAYLSFYTRVFPLLKAFNFPAVLGVVGAWTDLRRTAPVMYGEQGTSATPRFATWRQIREMSESGLVEIASHTYDLHRGLPANPEGNLEPAAISRIYYPATDSYEADHVWRERVRADLAKNSNAIERETGRRPRTIVWPYGAYNDELVKIAGELGMPVALTLDDGPNTPDVALTALHRTLIEHNPALIEFAIEGRGAIYPEPVRVVQVELDEIFDPDPGRQERNLSALLDRLDVLMPTQVYLRATSRPDGDGKIQLAYFPNRHLPMRADLFNRVAWQVASRLDTKVFAVMPLNGLHQSEADALDLFSDLAANAYFEGLVFDDGASPTDVDLVGSLPLSEMLIRRVRAFRAPMKTVRLLYPSSNLQMPAGGKREGQNLSSLLAAYDYVALISAPGLDPAGVHDSWPVRMLARYGRKADEADIRRKIIFLFSDRKGLAQEMSSLQRQGLINFGYISKAFLHDEPPLVEVTPAMSLRVFPLRLTKELP